ncbi:MAG: hypothetical protein J4F38_10520 [Pseudomonadales bacterium]|nr:hypothetical protein [Pseudomonadales bacterium]
MFVAFLLAVQGRDGEIDPGVEPTGRVVDRFREKSLRLGVLVAAHAGGAGVVVRGRVGTATGDGGNRDHQRESALSAKPIPCLPAGDHRFDFAQQAGQRSGSL